MISPETPPTPDSNRGRAALPFIFITLLIEVLGFGIIIPVLPDLVQKLTGGSFADGSKIFGWMISVYGLMQFLFAPVLGALSDRFGRRPVLLLSLAFTAVDYVLMAMAPTVGWLFVGRVVAGITGASFTAASAYIADISPPEKRAQNFGVIGAAFGVGFIIGPALGGVLGDYNPRLPFWVAMVLTTINLLYGFFILPESLAPEHRKALRLGSANPLSGLIILGRHGWILLLAGAVGLLGLAQQALQSTWVLSNEYRFHWSQRDNGLTLALLGVASIAVQMGVLRLMLPRFGEARTAMFGLVFQILGFLGFAFATQGWMMIAMMMVWSLSFVTGPSINGIVSKQYGPDEQGVVQGAMSSLQSLTGVIGPIITTAVFAYFISKQAPVRLPGAPYLLGSAFSLVAIFVAYSALQRRRSSPPEAA